MLNDLEELHAVLVAEGELAVKFAKEFEELHVWLTDTRSMLEVTGSPSGAAGMTMGVVASPALLRGKQQVRMGWAWDWTLNLAITIRSVCNFASM